MGDVYGLKTPTSMIPNTQLLLYCMIKKIIIILEVLITQGSTVVVVVVVIRQLVYVVLEFCLRTEIYFC